MLRGSYVVALGQDGAHVWVTNYPNGSWCFAWRVRARELRAIPNSRHQQSFLSEGWDLS